MDDAEEDAMLWKKLILNSVGQISRQIIIMVVALEFYSTVRRQGSQDVVPRGLRRTKEGGEVVSMAIPIDSN